MNGNQAMIKALLNMFSFLSGKITIALGATVGFLVLILKLKNHKIDNLEAENEADDKKLQIIDDMHLAEVKAEEKEIEANKDIDTDLWRGNLND